MERSSYSRSPWSVFESFWRQHNLILQMSKREVLGRYRGSLLGLLWSFFQPLLMLAVYTFMFGFIFKARWGVERETGLDFVLILFAGLIVHGLLAENLSRAPTLILSNVSYVKRVVFPLEALPWVALFASLFHALLSFGVLLVIYLLGHLTLQWTAVFLPVVVFPLAVMTVGFSWFLASLGVYIRDIGQLVGIVVTILLFLCPIFYPGSALPDWLQRVIYLNPLTLIVDQTRAVLLWGHLPDFGALGAHFAVSVAIAWLGFLWFQKSRRGFADVL
jgi:lipopolysaccharide transport system permease protein